MLGSRALAALIDPGALVAGAGTRPRWAGVLVLAAALVAASHLLFWTGAVGRQMLDTQRQELVERMRGRLPQESLDRLERAPMGYRQTGIGNGLGRAFGIIVSVLLWTAAVHLLLSVLLLRTDVTFAQVLSIFSHAALLWAASEMLSVSLMYLDGTMRSGSSLPALLPVIDWPSQSTFAGALLRRADLFDLWWVGVVSVGVARLAGVRVLFVVLAVAGVKLAMIVVAAAFFRPPAEGAAAPFGHGI